MFPAKYILPLISTTVALGLGINQNPVYSTTLTVTFPSCLSTSISCQSQLSQTSPLNFSGDMRYDPTTLTMNGNLSVVAGSVGRGASKISTVTITLSNFDLENSGNSAVNNPNVTTSFLTFTASNVPFNKTSGTATQIFSGNLEDLNDAIWFTATVNSQLIVDPYLSSTTNDKQPPFTFNNAGSHGFMGSSPTVTGQLMLPSLDKNNVLSLKNSACIVLSEEDITVAEAEQQCSLAASAGIAEPSPVLGLLGLGVLGMGTLLKRR